VPRGGGTGLAGGALPHPNGIVVSLERMARVIEVDEDAGWARVQRGITLADLDDALVTAGLCYPVYPGELSSTVGGNVATNAGGMRAVRFGTTRHNVLGLRLVTGGGDLVSTHGPLAKYSSGYDLTQLVIGSEGTLGLVTEVTIRLRPRAGTSALLVGAFGSLTVLPRAVARLLASGLEPALCEYVDSTAHRISSAHRLTGTGKGELGSTTGADAGRGAETLTSAAEIPLLFTGISLTI
jgi:glycolate oxidase